MAKSIKRNFIYNIILNVSKVIFPLITAPYVSRVLEPDGVGLFNFANTYAGYFALFAGLGIPFYGIREIAKISEDDKAQTKFVSEVVSISAMVTALCTLLYIASIFLIPQLNENFVIFLIAAAALYITPLRIDWFFSGKEEFGYIALRSIIMKTLSVIALFVLVHDKDDLIIYVILNTLSQVLNELWNYIKLLRLGIRPYFTLKGMQHFKPLLILFSSSVAISVYTTLDTLMLGFMTNYDEVGYYNNATHISKALVPIVTSLAAVAMPRLSKYKEDSNWGEISLLCNKSLSIVTFLCFPIAMGVMVVASTFVPLFFGELFYGTILPLQIVVLVVVAIGLNNLTGIQILVGLGFDSQFLKAVFIGASSNFFLNLILIPLLGASGAAIASVIAEFVILVVTAFYVYKFTPIRFTIGKEILLSFISILTFIPISILVHMFFSGWTFVAIDVLLSAATYSALQLIFKNPSLSMVVGLVKTKILKR